jgi:ADP-ribose pyrophosphatase YjhB (NUDIX family)
MNDTQADPEATIVTRRIKPLSPWLQIDEIEVRMPGSDKLETYHGIRQANAVGVLAMTTAGEFLLLRQYRPVVDAWTWELPAGAVATGETPAEAGARELNEETGFRVRRLIPVSATYEDPPRRTNKLFGFFAILDSGRDAHEPGMRSMLVSGPELRAMAASGDLAVPSQVALLFQAGLNDDVRALLHAMDIATPPWM